MRLFGMFDLFLLVISVTSVISDCYKDDKLYHEGDGWRESCIDYICIDGNFQPEAKGCYDSTIDRCREFGDLWGDNDCYQIGCEQSGGEVKQYFHKKGCKKGDGTCAEINTRYKENCATYECKMDGDSIKHELIEQGGCKIKGVDECYKDGDKIKHKCSMYLCDKDKSDLVLIDGKCQQDDKCYAIDSTWTKGDYEFTCIFDGENLTTSAVRISPESVATKCKHNDEEKDIGDKWMDRCFEMECIQTPEGNLATKIVSGGCSNDGHCVSEGDTWTRDCSIFKCVRKAHNHYVSVAEEIKCKTKDANGGVLCVEDGWTGQSPENKCVMQTCVVTELKWTFENKIECLAKDKNGTDICVPNGWTGKLPKKKCVIQRCIANAAGSKLHLDIACAWRDGECVASGETRTRKCISYKCNVTEIEEGSFQSRMEKKGRIGCYVTNKYKPISESIGDNCAQLGSLAKKYKKKKCDVFQCRKNGKKGFKFEKINQEVC